MLRWTGKGLSPLSQSCHGVRAMDQSLPASGPRVERFREYLCLLARSHLRSGHRSKIEASDIVQQTLLEAHVQREQFRGESDGELAAWLKQMLVHNLADALREGERAKRDVRRERPLDLGIEDSFCRAESWLAAAQPSPSQRAIQIEQLLELANGLAQLPDEQREAVVLHHLQGWPLAQISAQLHRSESAVAGLLHRGLKKLRQLMDEGSRS
jgi:RNA polymerase sigma-70 factor (ECF subfamily)